MLERERYRDNVDDCLGELYRELKGSTAALSKRLSIPHRTLGAWLTKHGISGTVSRKTAPELGERPGIELTADTAMIVGQPNPMNTQHQTPEELMRGKGLNPDEWTYEPTINQWDVLAGEGRVTTMHQLKIHCKRRLRLDLLTPARTKGWMPLKRNPRPRTDQPQTILVCSDPHHPFIDRGLEQCMLQMLEDVKPIKAFDLGDGLDLPNPSRFRPNPATDVTPQACIDSEYQSWLARIAASPGTAWSRLPGNHDERIKNAQLDRIASIYGIRRAQTEAQILKDGVDLPVLDVGYLLRLDELGVTMHRPDGDGQYHHAQVQIVPGLLASHGTKTGKHGGATTAGNKLTCSWMQGHDHKQSIAYITRHDDHGNVTVIILCSVGTLGVLDHGYTDHPEAQQGFATVTVWPDGKFHIELARYDAGELLWRDRRYAA